MKDTRSPQKMVIDLKKGIKISIIVFFTSILKIEIKKPNIFNIPD
jgi:hypothetical protein